jgi:hypothetical protein
MLFHLPRLFTMITIIDYGYEHEHEHEFERFHRKGQLRPRHH